MPALGNGSDEPCALVVPAQETLTTADRQPEAVYLTRRQQQMPTIGTDVDGRGITVTAEGEVEELALAIVPHVNGNAIAIDLVYLDASAHALELLMEQLGVHKILNSI